MTKKQKYVPIVLAGSFFDEEIIRDALEVSSESIEDITELFKGLFSDFNFSEYPEFMKNVVLIHTSKILYEDVGETKGYYIGLPYFEVPDHFSIKRVCLDVRSLFVSVGIIPEDISPDFVRVFSKILKV